LAINRGDFASALSLLEKVRSEGPKETDHLESALTGLGKLARAQMLAQAIRFDNRQPEVPPGLLAGCVSCLEHEAVGRTVLDAAQRGDMAAARDGIEALARRDDLEPETAHHLALIFLRGALWLEESDADRADKLWRCSWRCWLCWAQTANASDLNLIFSRLLAEHRRAIIHHMARGAVDAGRRHWRCVMDLGADPLMAKRVDRFRDELTTEYLVHTRESMRYGTIPAGYDADFEAGLNCLSRLLSLDSNNARLLSEAISICTEWFQESYEIGDLHKLARGVERFTPLALQLARQIEQSGGAELTAHGVLAEFTNFRGFVCNDPVRKAELYREAQRLHPSHRRPNMEALP
jgi:hypothetical protein